MGRTITVSAYVGDVDVDVDVSDLDTQDMIDELVRRGVTIPSEDDEFEEDDVLFGVSYEELQILKNIVGSVDCKVGSAEWFLFERVTKL